MLDITVDDCIIVETAPSSKILRQAVTASKQAVTASSETASTSKKMPYFDNVLQLHDRLYPRIGATRITQKERRGKGSTRAIKSNGPETEAAFGRKRAAAVADVVAASPAQQRRMIIDAPLGLADVAEEVARESALNPVAATAVAIKKVAKREGNAKKLHSRGQTAAAKARAQSVVQPSTGLNATRDAASARKPALALVRLSDADARRKALERGFTAISDPVEFVTKVAKFPPSLRARTGSVVIAPLVDTDFALSGIVTAAFMGAFFVSPPAFLDKSPRGVFYTEKHTDPKKRLHVAVTASIADELPSLQQILERIASSAGSCLKVNGMR